MPIATGNKTLLTLDSIANLALGVLLMTFPATLVDMLGIPAATHSFYPSILGAVLFGIGIALWISRSGSPSGLGLIGAVSINLCGGIALAFWLLFGNLVIPARGQILLVVLTVFLIGISAAEIVSHYRRNGGVGAG